MYKKIQGTIDYFGDKILKFNHIINTFKNIVSIYNYEEFLSPVIEYADLFKRSIGDLTDIVEKEMYIFNSSSGKQIALRPENTAGLIRGYIENNLHFVPGLKRYFYSGAQFRRERPQKGRLRQFHQVGCEVVGSNSPLLDAEIISMASKYLKKLNITNIVININSIGCKNCRSVYVEKLKKYYNEIKNDICQNCLNRLEKNPLRILDCKVQQCQQHKNNAPKITDNLCSDCEQHFEKLKKTLDDYKLEYTINKFLVRGLDYYTNTIFEFTNNDLGSQNAVLAGGRYNYLIKHLGGSEEPAVGFAAGVERLMLSLNDDFMQPKPKKLFIAIQNDTAYDFAVKLSEKIRLTEKVAVELNYFDKSLKAQLRIANKRNFDYLIVIGDSESETKTFRIKNFNTGKEEEFTIENIESFMGG
jgi:histidyl-tRNA synthetase